MADFSQNKKYNYNWQSAKFKNLALSGSYISQFINDAGYVTSSVAVSASYALTASYLTGTITSASYARTASYVNPLNQNVIITGSLLVTQSHISTVDYVDFTPNKYDTVTPGVIPTHTEGRLFYDTGSQTLCMYNSEADVTLNIGQESWLRARNQTGVTITNGSVVKISGATGNRPNVILAQSVDQTSIFSSDNDIIGMVTHDIEHGTDGFVTTFGLVNGVNTAGYTAGDALFVSQSAGKYTNVAPPAPYDKTFVGYVTRVNVSQGSIFISPNQPLHFHDISSVSASVYAQGDLWMYKQTGSSGVWINTRTLSGSYSLTGSLNATSFTGSLSGTASYALSASYAPSTPAFPYTGSALITGSLGVTGSISLRAYTGSSDTIMNITSTTGTQYFKAGGDGLFTFGTYTNPSTRLSVTSGTGLSLYCTGVGTAGYFQNETSTGTGYGLQVLGRQYGSASPSGYVAYGILTGADTTLGINYGLRSYAYNGSTNYAGYFDAAAGTNNYAIVTQRGFSGFGKTDPAAMVDIKAAGALSTDIALRVRNSVDSDDILKVMGNMSMNLLGAGTGGYLNLSRTTGGVVKLMHRATATLPSQFLISSYGDGGSIGQIVFDTVFGNDSAPNFTMQRFISGLSDLTGSALYTPFGSNAAAFVMKNALNYAGYGIVPTGTATDHFAMYAADANGTAGAASPHFRTEDGSVLWLGTNSKLLNLTLSGSTLITGSLSVTGSITVGNITSTPSTENTLNVYPPFAGGTGEGGQILLAASGGLYTSASMLDNWQNQFRVLKGTNTGGSTAGLVYVDLQNGNTNFVGAVTASAYSGLPNDYLYATRSGSAQTVGSNWVSQDVIFNNTVVSKGISYNTGTGLASLTGGKVYRVTARLAWGAAATYNLQFSCYTSTNVQIGPTVEIIQSTNGTNNISDGTLEFIYAPGSNTDIKIRTTSANTALSGETIRADLNTQFIIQQIA